MQCLSIILEYITVMFRYLCSLFFQLFFSQGAVIEACIRAVSILRIYLKQNTQHTFIYEHIFVYCIFTLPGCVYATIAM